jgi:excinuclease ABC subunit B
MDADKEGFLRNVRSLTQMAGRAARHPNGRVILYADNCSDSMRVAIEQSNRRREKQIKYNIEHGMVPNQAKKSGKGQSLLLAGTERPEDMNVYPIHEEHYGVAADIQSGYNTTAQLDKTQLNQLIDKAREDMERAAKALDFLAAARYRDRMYELQKLKEFY